MNLAQVQDYLSHPYVPSLTAQSSITAWISKPVDPDQWLLLTEFQRKYGLRRRPERKFDKPNPGRAGRPIQFMGKSFKTIVDAARMYHIPVNTLKSQLKRGS